jgi:outer membrane lipoprotein-sorting protein
MAKQGQTEDALIILDDLAKKSPADLMLDLGYGMVYGQSGSTFSAKRSAAALQRFLDGQGGAISEEYRNTVQGFIATLKRGQALDQTHPPVSQSEAEPVAPVDRPGKVLAPSVASVGGELDRGADLEAVVKDILAKELATESFTKSEETTIYVQGAAASVQHSTMARRGEAVNSTSLPHPPQHLLICTISDGKTMWTRTATRGVWAREVTRTNLEKLRNAGANWPERPKDWLGGINPAKRTLAVETLDGKQCLVVEGPTTTGYKARFWFETATGFSLQMEMRNHDGTLMSRCRVTEYAVNPALDPASFVYKPTFGETVRDKTDEMITSGIKYKASFKR